MKISPEALEQGLTTNILRYYSSKSSTPWCLLWSKFDRKAKRQKKFFSSQQDAEAFFIDIRKLFFKKKIIFHLILIYL